MKRLVRINPGSNVHGENKTGTAVPGMQNVEILEPLAVGGMLQCPVCGATFSSKADYDSHAMARHQPSEERVEPK